MRTSLLSLAKRGTLALIACSTPYMPPMAAKVMPHRVCRQAAPLPAEKAPAYTMHLVQVLLFLYPHLLTEAPAEAAPELQALLRKVKKGGHCLSPIHDEALAEALFVALGKPRAPSVARLLTLLNKRLDLPKHLHHCSAPTMHTTLEGVKVALPLRYKNSHVLTLPLEGSSSVAPATILAAGAGTFIEWNHWVALSQVVRTLRGKPLTKEEQEALHTYIEAPFGKRRQHNNAISAKERRGTEVVQALGLALNHLEAFQDPSRIRRSTTGKLEVWVPQATFVEGYRTTGSYLLMKVQRIRKQGSKHYYHAKPLADCNIFSVADPIARTQTTYHLTRYAVAYRTKKGTLKYAVYIRHNSITYCRYQYGKRIAVTEQEFFTRSAQAHLALYRKTYVQSLPAADPLWDSFIPLLGTALLGALFHTWSFPATVTREILRIPESEHRQLAFPPQAVLQDGYALPSDKPPGGMCNLNVTCYINTALQALFCACDANVAYREALLHLIEEVDETSIQYNWFIRMLTYLYTKTREGAEITYPTMKNFVDCMELLDIHRHRGQGDASEVLGKILAYITEHKLDNQEEIKILKPIKESSYLQLLPVDEIAQDDQALKQENIARLNAPNQQDGSIIYPAGTDVSIREINVQEVFVPTYRLSQVLTGNNRINYRHQEEEKQLDAEQYHRFSATPLQANASTLFYLSFKRTQYQAGSNEKAGAKLTNYATIKVKMEGSEITSEAHLIGVGAHSGTANSGHWVFYRREGDGAAFRQYSDTSVSQPTYAIENFASQATLLVYDLQAPPSAEAV